MASALRVFVRLAEPLLARHSPKIPVLPATAEAIPWSAPVARYPPAGFRLLPEKLQQVLAIRKRRRVKSGVGAEPFFQLCFPPKKTMGTINSSHGRVLAKHKTASHNVSLHTSVPSRSTYMGMSRGGRPSVREARSTVSTALFVIARSAVLPVPQPRTDFPSAPFDFNVLLRKYSRASNLWLQELQTSL